MGPQSPSLRLDHRLVARLHRQAGASRWGVSMERFASALEASAAKSFGAVDPPAPGIQGYLEGLHLEDLALACACADGHDAAWEHFVREQRPVLYRAADALDPGGGARDVADALYAELFGVRERDGARRSLFAYFHGRSSLSTWLRAILAQRYVDRIRAGRRIDPLPDEPERLPAAPAPPDPERPRYLAALAAALAFALDALPARERLRIGCYYTQRLTLAEIGRLFGEHEATVSRRLARSRRTLREAIVRHLRQQSGLSDDDIDACFETAIDDAGTIDLETLLRSEGRKDSELERS